MSDKGADADVIVVGAGAAGIGVATLLSRGGRRVLVLERADAPGAAWRGRYERLHLHTSRRWSNVAGSTLRSAERFVSASAYADHVHAAARDAGLDVRTSTPVVRIGLDASVPTVHLDDGSILRAHDVVVASGQNDVPAMPPLPGRDRFPGDVLHADAYRTGAPYRDRRVLVVGTGNTGTELAQDLVEHGAASVTVAMRSIPRIVPRALGPFTSHGVACALRRALGARGMRRATTALGLVRSARLRRLGLYPPAPASQLRVPTLDHGFVAAVAAGQVRLVPALTALDDQGAVLADDTRVSCDVVILATGYRPAAAELFAPELHADLAPDRLADPALLASRGVWFVGFGSSPLGQLVLAREQAAHVATSILSR